MEDGQCSVVVYKKKKSLLVSLKPPAPLVTCWFVVELKEAIVLNVAERNFNTLRNDTHNKKITVSPGRE